MNIDFANETIKLRIVKILLLSLSMFVLSGSDAFCTDNDEAKNIYNLKLTTQEQMWINTHPNPRIGVWINVPPYAYPDSNGNPQGIFPDYIKEIENCLNMFFDIVPVPSFAVAWEKAINRELDLLVAVTPSEKHLQYMNLSQTYHVVPVVLVTRSDMPFVSSIKWFNGKKVVVGKNHVTEQWIKRDFPEIQLVPSEDYEKGLRRISQGRADAYVGAMAALTWQINKFRITNLKIAAKTPYEYKLSIAVRKDWPELIPILNKALDSIKKRKQDSIYEKWVSIRFEQGVNWSFIWRISGGVIFFSIIICFVILIWNRRLKYQIHEKEKAEKALLKSEEKFRNIVENATNLFYSHTADHKLTYISPQCRDFLQCEPEEAMVKWTEFATDNPINEKGFKITQKTIDTGKPQKPYTLELIGKKGKKILVEVNETPVVKNGKTTVIVGSLTNITERKNAEDALMRERDNLQKAVDEIKTLRGILPICSLCKKIRDDKGYWKQIEAYVEAHSDVDFSHSICPECAEKYYPEMDLYDDEKAHD